jgi:1-aminocyclopropane-1-carboxylate deaminase/D-cysteine desulfhydrase-like pyridoxal-dependent ACC family enzyme
MAVSVGQMDREVWVRREGLTLSGNKYYKLVQAADEGSV